MCIIVYRPVGEVFPSDEVLAHCWSVNPHGAGFMYAKEGKLVIEKGFMTLEAFMFAYITIPEAVSAVLHFRIGTHGANTPENTHPWPVIHTSESVSLAMVHNGVLAGYGDREYSDSRDFAENLAPLGVNGPFHPNVKRLIQGNIGHSKLVFMRNDGRVEIFNKDQGVMNGGCWFSNSNFRPYVAPPKTAWNDFIQGQYMRDREDFPPYVTQTKTEIKKGVIVPTQTKTVIFNPKDYVIKVERVGKDVRITHADRTSVIYGLTIFLSEYSDYTYSTYLTGRIDDMVTQWEIDLAHEEAVRAAKDEIK